MLSPSWGGRGAFGDLGILLVDLLRRLRPEAGLTVRAASLRPLPAGRGRPGHGAPGDQEGAGVADAVVCTRVLEAVVEAAV
ncbi:hypothetical protein ACFY1U_45185 [Streptomyces sp. NPDC001351]|uniref:hypothetical protein n=1 Tax=Streptomyces sp. NPDC001351 TaxID=3364564 RepID=UPI0036BA8A3F